MRKMLWLAILFGNYFVAFAQQPSANTQKPNSANVAQTPKGNGRISGIIVDPETNKPVEYATVALFPAGGEKPIDGTVCNEKGQFELKGLVAGTYKVTVSFLGYESKTLSEIVLAGANSEVSLGQVTLKSDAKKLNEVNITTERELIENKIDRIVYNAEKDASNRGGNASDVLKKSTAGNCGSGW